MSLATRRIERALETAIARAAAPTSPGRLAAALRYAVFPHGALLRPRLCLAVADACGEDDPVLTDAAAAAIELMHCASLVHDDLPCFDDAALRRGRPSLHRAFDERVAVLAGDALIVLAFQVVCQAAAVPSRRVALIATLCQAVGMPGGIVAGQAWECEATAPLATYHRQKTGALFAGATMMGAAAAGADPHAWRLMGERLGETYQAADDIGDACSTQEDLGKPVGQDYALDRPNAVREFGLAGAVARLEELLAATIAAIPPCPGAQDLETLILAEAKRLVPKSLAAHAA